ncbi:MAG: hypothetical protein RL394_249, partial [Bacteroidota bacterium]
MFDTKNYSPQKIALFAATTIGLLSAVIVGWTTKRYFLALVVFLIIFGFSFWVVRFLVEKFIHRQIK